MIVFAHHSLNGDILNGMSKKAGSNIYFREKKASSDLMHNNTVLRAADNVSGIIVLNTYPISRLLKMNLDTATYIKLEEKNSCIYITHVRLE